MITGIKMVKDDYWSINDRTDLIGCGSIQGPREMRNIFSCCCAAGLLLLIALAVSAFLSILLMD